jgi:hypothetical protein
MRMFVVDWLSGQWSWWMMEHSKVVQGTSCTNADVQTLLPSKRRLLGVVAKNG